MKYHWNRWAGRIALGVVGTMTAAGGPALIHVCWQAGWGAAMPWGAGELLEYYGTILGAVLTVATVVVTVRFTRKQILRETDLESARRKWGRIEETFEGVLDAVNPFRLLQETILEGSRDPTEAIRRIQAYQMISQTAADRLIAFLNPADYARVRALADGILALNEIVFPLCEERERIYERVERMREKDAWEDLLRRSTQDPDACSKRRLLFVQNQLAAAAGDSPEAIQKDLRENNGKLAAAYEQAYRDLLRQKGALFEKIRQATRENADRVLARWN